MRITNNAPDNKQSGGRLESLDVLRGFDMLFISGGATLIYLLKGKTNLPWVDVLADQFKHPEWHGFTFYDFIFPLFLFMAGVSMSYSLSSGVQKGIPKIELYKKLFKRMLVLIALGLVYKNNPLKIFEPETIRFGSVLGRIGFATFVSGILYVNFPKKQLYWISGIVLGYYAALFLIPAPGYLAGDLSFEGNLPGWIDRHIMPGRLLQKTYDELAFSTQLPSLCLTLFGTIAGDILRKNSSLWQEKLQRLIIFGVVSIGIGLIWSLHFPINKHLWSSSFVLLTAGMSFLFLALFYWVIDIKKYKRIGFFFKVIGMNSLLIYLANGLFNMKYTSTRLFKGIYQYAPEQWHDFYIALGALGVTWFILYFLYKNKVFLKI
ncbi:acyltransferase family protein [Pedobacter arcticus]|uniref:acyltransferase family protein n=1 Tax=Pedobacter arcticus TaxID=752140 RepID=UPI0002F5110E|nr:DUF5009 domain-containing protein [Pedobacter arcticus]